MFRTSAVLDLAVATMAAFCASAVAADAYPHKPLRLIVPTATGGSTDVVARIIGTQLAERLKTQVVVDNRGGAGGAIGVETAAKAAADGHTLLLVSASQMTLPALRKLPYDPIKSFVPIAKLASVYLALVVHPSVEASSVQEFIALAKRKPGAIIFSGSGPGAHTTMATELFKSMAGVDVVIVEYKSGGPAVIDLLGGHTQAMLATIPSVLPHIKAGKLKVLATSGAERSNLLPDAPTIDKAGVPGYSTVQWHGIVAPAGTPQSIIDLLHTELKAILASDEGKKRLVGSGAEIDYLPPKEFGVFMRRDMEQWSQLIRKAGIKVRDQ
ncbi:MAG: extra-cytoplasmic solute receptor [Betaproteobacteria bacterium]|jgi:tripartite-type tricarboxylate transporter receptor subunit TctC|nr:extra-cytoplasmic solute receptor [Betaproteobacteria bacterium]